MELGTRSQSVETFPGQISPFFRSTDGLSRDGHAVGSSRTLDSLTRSSTENSPSRPAVEPSREPPTRGKTYPPMCSSQFLFCLI